MSIILEGVDAVGKSTVANDIAKKYNYQIVHSGAKEKNDLEYYKDLLLNNNNLILDRAFISEIVFSNLYNRKSKLTFSDIMSLSNIVKENNDILIIMISSDLSIIKNRLIERGELDYLNEYEDQYNEFMKWIYVLNAYFDDYLNYKVIDISKPDSYIKLNDWLTWRINEFKGKNYDCR